MNWIFSLLLISFLIAAPYHSARGAVFIDPRQGPACGASTNYCFLLAKIYGEITAADFDEVKRLIDQTHRKAESENRDIVPPFIKLDSPGGNVTAAMAIGRLLRKEQARVRIDPEAVCYSACVLVLASAVGRDMVGKVGIHRPYLEVPKDAVSPNKVSELFQRTLQDIRSYFREMNVSEQLADAMLRIDPENMRLLNNATLNNYGLTYEDPIARETKELRIAQAHGLNRQEYMRRKILAERRCGGPGAISSKCYQNIIATGQVPIESPSPEELAPDFSYYGR